ncbi:Hypothetical protein NTJ_14129 [Nesidiocoris tenuis]|uniref:Uncharacterized protein n=1 Tax=Nesidiocoris tenuis TaxID=355587 RepID=A0ABN7BCA3_9HEMI|nr:Hypothetical protein NTJ_14129 [Nesidiocoris tenuis]
MTSGWWNQFAYDLHNVSDRVERKMRYPPAIKTKEKKNKEKDEEDKKDKNDREEKNDKKNMKDKEDKKNMKDEN